MFTMINKKMKHRKGFTLIELMVVIAIIGILAAVAIPRFANTTASANGGKILADLGSIDSAVSMWMANHPGANAPALGAVVADGFLASAPNPPVGTATINGHNVPAALYAVDAATGRATYGGATAEQLQAP